MPFEGFECECCGHCCLNLTDVCETECTTEDYERWEAEERYDILEWSGLSRLMAESSAAISG